MKFILQSISKCSARFGYIHEIDRLPGCVLETPLLLIHTRGGSVPHLTYEVLLKVTKEPLGIQLPLPTIMHCEEAVSEFKKGIAKFIGFSDYLTYCSVQDPAVATPQGFNEKDVVSLFSRSGKQQISPDKYMDIMEAFCPDMYQALCDGNTNVESSKKRVQKAVDRSSRFFERCMERHNKSKILQKTAILGVIEGGYNITARQACAKEVASSNVSGFVIDGLHNNGPEVEDLPIEKVKPIIEATMKHLPENKIRIVHGCWNPETVLDMIELGVDMFDTSYPFIVSERGSALIFHNQLDNKCHTNSINDNCPTPDVTVANSEIGKQEPGQLPHDIEVAEEIAARKYEISLKDKRYFDDFGPLEKSCACLACKKHTRAYVHHLLNTNELLGSVLLMIHNLHHYLQFFHSIRSALKEDAWSSFRALVAKDVQV